ncbi:MAG: hypothetical protein ACHQ6U_07220 [Thermodesulfobacteriota bacterium]
MSALIPFYLECRTPPNLVSPIKWSNVTFLLTDHLVLTKSPAFSDNVLFIFLEEPGS